MNRRCVRRWRRARKPNKAKTQEEESPIRTVSVDARCCFSLYDFLFVHNILACWNALSSAFAALEPLHWSICQLHAVCLWQHGRRTWSLASWCQHSLIWPGAGVLVVIQEQKVLSLSGGNGMSPLALEWSLCSGWFVASTAFHYSALWLLMRLIFASLFHHRFLHWFLFPYQNSHVAQITGLVVLVCRRAASFHSTTDTIILQKPPYSTGSAPERTPASSSPISIQHRKPSSFSSPINSHRKPPSSSSPICSQPKIPPAARSPINSQHRIATVSSSPSRSTTQVTDFYFLGGKKIPFCKILGLKETQCV